MALLEFMIIFDSLDVNLFWIITNYHKQWQVINMINIKLTLC